MDRNANAEWQARYDAHVRAGMSRWNDAHAKATEDEHLQALALLIFQGLQAAKTSNPDALSGLDSVRWAELIAASL